jgi:hypothetical protein
MKIIIKQRSMFYVTNDFSTISVPNMSHYHNFNVSIYFKVKPAYNFTHTHTKYFLSYMHERERNEHESQAFIVDLETTYSSIRQQFLNMDICAKLQSYLFKSSTKHHRAIHDNMQQVFTP